MKKFRSLIAAMIIGICAFSQVQVVTLNGSASTDADGNIQGWKWIQIGNTPSQTVITNANQAIATVVPAGGLQWQPGSYLFELTVTDNFGATAKDTVRISFSSQPPTVDAGLSQTVQSTATVTLKATAKATYGIIKSWAWSQVSGPGTAIFNRKDTSTVTLSGLVAGVYVLKVQVVDNYGATASDTMTVTAIAPNQAPKANAGPDIQITLPVNSVSIGRADQPPGLTVKWKKISGPAGDIIQSPTDPITIVKNLSQGQFVYQKVVTNAAGQSASDNVTIIVRKCSWWMQLFGRC